MKLQDLFEAVRYGPKGWFNTNDKTWIEISGYWHHSSFVWNHPDLFSWNDIFGYSPEDYLEQFNLANMLPPDYDETIIEPLIDHGWVRMTSTMHSDNNLNVYLDAKSDQPARTAIRYIIQKIISFRDIHDITIQLSDGPALKFDQKTVMAYLRGK